MRIKGMVQSIKETITRDLKYKLVAFNREYQEGYKINNKEVRNESLSIQKSRIYNDEFQIVSSKTYSDDGKDRVSLLNISKDDLIQIRDMIDKILK